MNKLQELEMWSILRFRLKEVPKDCQSQCYTAFCSEAEGRIYDLVNELGLDLNDWPV
jgi:hypothetical protein